MSVPIRSLSNHELLTRTETLVARERELTLDVLLHLNEIERRRLFLKQGYASMFVYCTTTLGYSESAANRRIRTARCIARFPTTLDLLKRNEVNLSTVTRVSRILTAENAEVLLDRIRGKSQRAVDAIVAEYEPRSTLPPDRVRTVVIPVVKRLAPTLMASQCKESYRRSGGEIPPTESPIAPTMGDAARSTRLPPPVVVSSTTPLERHAIVQFTTHQNLLNKLERVRSLASHRLPIGAPFENLIEFLAEYFIRREDPRARHERRLERSTTVEAPTSAASSVEDARELSMPGASPRQRGAPTPRRAVSAHVRDEVFVRDEGKCAYVAPDGMRCESLHLLQIDHITPVARGGRGTIDNLRLLCAHHNRLEAERLMGARIPPG